MSADPSSSNKMRAAAAKRGGTRPPLPHPPPPPASGRPPRLYRILLVEDEESLGRALIRWLRDYDVVYCASLSEALKRIRSDEPFDVVLSDVMMRGGDAPQLYAAIEAEAPQLLERMLFMTGGATTQEALEFVGCHTSRVIPKPLDLVGLRERLARLLSELATEHPQR
jgi:DNA-binding NtrC family response regulator